MRPRLVGFDAFGTLFSFRHPPGHTYYQLALKHGIQIPRNIAAVSQTDAADLMHLSLMKALEEQSKSSPTNYTSAITTTGSPSKESSSRLWWELVVRRTLELATGIAEPPQRFAEYFNDLFHHFSTADPYLLFPDTKPALETLRQRHKSNVHLVCLSNSDERLLGILKGLGIADYFDLILSSKSLGVQKPNPEFFRLALKHLSDPAPSPSECLYVGDDIHRDYDGAINAGWESRLINRSGGSKSGGNDRVDVRAITSLIELVYSS